MHPVRKQRLILVVFVVAFSCLAVGLLTYALRENINLFYPPSSIVAGQAPVDKRIRAGGCVLPGQVKRAADSLDVNFLITDGAANVEVHYSGILPDLFAEGEAVVVNGSLNGDGVFMATEVLAKHDETYMPPEVSDSIQQSGALNAANSGQHQATCEGMQYGS
ncbi:MAG: cytochrome c maturation protein CcmE [Gammaproteobacteria bacterium]|uniref:cytochrome c maturation protein CcmE n=1 Tax=Pseudomaricurvus alcaniphilus TaxID=1166482 RepID=UPI00140E714A|nr:cytochrome c maturation protein CcmE [Pseudomaricurvus alcaniphilus]MBR9912151.1 cytochrome c maturation protein CcmE [Gammaproteobacteria bacterium]NHN35709.1 cytochrome c maturation protein CcmE [Pseudomaricurvus alcaniphilus]